ncbi:hypothetical protein [Salipiger aestuarii]|uniref:hypothetical protein n=1 Tax=Salipiger aestuarii TaxID=568098 RepID=UPI00123AF6FE|nr:hypothetical protein [Salipiger aestuarii]
MIRQPILLFVRQHHIYTNRWTRVAFCGVASIVIGLRERSVAMRFFLMTTMAGGLLAGAAQAQELFVPTIQARQIDGSYNAYPIKGTEAGMLRSDCDRQARTWEQKNRTAIRAADSAMSSPGNGDAVEVICKLKQP